MRRFSSLIFFFFIFLIFPSSVSAQVVINEFSSNSDTEWVELYNTTSNMIDLSGWGLQDEAQPLKILSGSIPASGYFIFENPSGWLNNSGSDTITLKDLGSVVVDSVHYGSGGVVSIPNSDKSAGRVSNGSSNWQNNLSWTKGSANPDPTAPPSPLPTPTPEPTQSPTPTAIPTKSSTPVPTKSPTPKPTKTPTASPEVLGEEVTPSPEVENPTSTPLVLDSKEKKVPIIPVVLIVSGLAMIGFAILQLVNAKKSTPEA